MLSDPESEDTDSKRVVEGVAVVSANAAARNRTAAAVYLRGSSLSSVSQGHVGYMDAAKIPVDTIVRKIVFPKVKFIKRNDVRLNYSDQKSSICMKVLTGCNVGPNINREEFWKTAKGWLVTRISNTRSDVTKQIKQHFWSKYVSVYRYNCFV